MLLSAHHVRMGVLRAQHLPHTLQAMVHRELSVNSETATRSPVRYGSCVQRHKSSLALFPAQHPQAKRTCILLHRLNIDVGTQEKQRPSRRR
jgi:hypothetical protein